MACCEADGRGRRLQAGAVSGNPCPAVIQIDELPGLGDVTDNVESGNRSFFAASKARAFGKPFAAGGVFGPQIVAGEYSKLSAFSIIMFMVDNIADVPHNRMICRIIFCRRGAARSHALVC